MTMSVHVPGSIGAVLPEISKNDLPEIQVLYTERPAADKGGQSNIAPGDVFRCAYAEPERGAFREREQLLCGGMRTVMTDFAKKNFFIT